jgi:N-methylhydantoinase A
MEGELADLPLHFPMIDVHSIGAGGGSIARLTPAGSLQVGPDSAGADPGPVCYDRGGYEPTVTDAHLVLGRLGASLVGGEVQLHRELASAAIAQRIARPLHLSVEEAANGILELLNHTMVGAIRAASIERGYDPRDFVLLACGGAGPLHAGRLAALLGIPTVIVPRQAGVLSTLGLLASDIKNDYVRTLMQRHGTFDLARLNAALQELETQARFWLTSEGIGTAVQQVERFADLRYAHQGYEITVPVPAGPLTTAILEQTLSAFHQEHQRLYTYASPDLPVELVNLRVSALGPAWPFTPASLAAGEATTAQPPASRSVYFPSMGGFVTCPVYDYASLGPDFAVTGPAILTQELTTIVVEPQHRARLDNYGNILMEMPQST